MLLMLAPLTVCACSSWRPPVLAADYVPVEYFPENLPGVESTVRTFVAADGAELGFTSYRSTGARSGIGLVYLHGVESHAGWFKGVAERLALQGHDVHCLDRRGSGINREPRGLPSGDIDRWETWLSDVHDLRTHLAPDYRELHAIGLSWGGKQAVAHAILHPEDFESLILITPGLRSYIDLGWPARAAVTAGAALFPRKAIELPLKAEMFTRNPVFKEKIRADPVRLRHVTMRFARNNAAIDRKIRRGIEDELNTPILLMLAGQDPIIDNDGVLQLLERAPMEPYEIVTLKDEIHSIQFDATDTVADRIVAWLDSLDTPDKAVARP